MSSLKDYLASKYLSNPSSSKKAKSRKQKGSSKSTSLSLLVDDDANDSLLSSNASIQNNTLENSTKKLSFEEFSRRKRVYPDDDDDEDGSSGGAPLDKNKEFIPSTKKKPVWKSLSGDIKETSTSKTNSGDINNNSSSVSKFYGLKTADQISAHFEEKEAAEAAIRESLKPPSNSNSASPANTHHETVYRDSSGRKITDISTFQSQAAAANAEAVEARKKLAVFKEINTGLVQSEQERRRQTSLKNNAAKTQQNSDNGLDTFFTYTRGRDDKKLNDQLKNRIDKFNDPAAMLISSKKKILTKSKNSKSTEDDVQLQLQIYAGHYAPNRFSIPPGSMWDGVDRSNGFEELWYKKDTEIKEKKIRQYEMSYDV